LAELDEQQVGLLKWYAKVAEEENIAAKFVEYEVLVLENLLVELLFLRLHHVLDLAEALAEKVLVWHELRILISLGLELLSPL
jgi:hypothetical protein